MNVRVGDIIKLENNQFVAVSVAPTQEWSWLGGTQGQWRGTVLLHHLLGWRSGTSPLGSCI